MSISEKDAKAIHVAIHSGKKSVTLTTGEEFPVEEKSKIRRVQVGPVKVMEQNKSKPSAWGKKAKAGAKITWFIFGSPWGRIVDGVIESPGKAITSTVSTKAPPKKPAMIKVFPLRKRPAGSEPDAGSSPPVKRPRTGDFLKLAPLFKGSGHGGTWEKIIRPVLEALPDSEEFIGPNRDKKMVPVRELTFQALKPNPPSGWRVVSLGQSPYPRVESATGIAHFDSTISSWNDKRFSVVTSMRCIIKAAAMNKYNCSQSIKVQDLRDLLQNKKVVEPAEWFQAMLAQGVLFMNAALSLVPPDDKTLRAGAVVDEHTQFWKPVVKAVVDAILNDCQKKKKGIVFAWWGTESMKTRSFLKDCFSKYPNVEVAHVVHKNPAAAFDSFCDPPNVFGAINKSLKDMKLGSIDWLPSQGWKKGAAQAAKMGAFIAETKDLHKMYLDRLKDGLASRGDELADITGIADLKLKTLPETCEPIKLTSDANSSLAIAKGFSRGKLTVDEAAAVHLYTTNALYAKLNAALRSKDRKGVKVYMLYLKLFINALGKLPVSKKKLYRGVDLDLSKHYEKGATITWWAVSSCTQELEVAKSFGAGGGGTLFVISPTRSVGVKHLSEYQEEEEFLLAPGTQLTVTNLIKKGGMTEIYLDEQKLPRRVR